MLVAFDVLASDKADLERLFRLLTQRFAFSDSGRSSTRNAKSAPATTRFRHSWRLHCAR
ncbi:hypothetical protein ACP0HM_02050 [Escherichia coli]